jgi:formyl-CoA transferase
MAGLYRRERTGKGGLVHTSLMANGVWWQGIQAQAMLSGAEFERRPAREDATNALQNVYRARDGRWFQLVLIPEERHWSNLVQAIGRPEVGADPRFAERSARHANARALIGVLDEAFGSQDWEHWKAAFREYGLTYGAIGTLRDIPDDAQMLAADVLTPIDDPRAGASHVVNSPLWVAEAPKRRPALAPALGEHTAEVLREHGYDDAGIEALRAAGAIPR